MTNEIIITAKKAVKGKWWKLIGILLLTSLITGIPSIITVIPNIPYIIEYVIAPLLSIVLSFLLSIGMINYLFNTYHQKAKLEDLFIGFECGKMSLKMLGALGVLFLAEVIIVIVDVLLCLFGVIGIIASVALTIWFITWILYFTCPFYLLIENPDMGIFESFKKSKEITKGHRWTYIWSQLKVVLIPLIIIIISMLAIMLGIGFGILAKDAAASGAITAILGFIGAAVGYIWLIVLIPLTQMIPVAYYEYFKAKIGLTPVIESSENSENVESEEKEIDDPLATGVVSEDPLASKE